MSDYQTAESNSFYIAQSEYQPPDDCIRLTTSEKLQLDQEGSIDSAARISTNYLFYETKPHTV